jgi:hypothetical protein
MWSNDQQRFLTVYRERGQIAPAAREAAIHRSTVYRWRNDPAFVAAMEAAARAGYEQWRREVYEPQEAARQAERQRRNAELRPMRQAIQAKAMEARRQKRGY